MLEMDAATTASEPGPDLDAYTWMIRNGRPTSLKGTLYKRASFNMNILLVPLCCLLVVPVLPLAAHLVLRHARRRNVIRHVHYAHLIPDLYDLDCIDDVEIGHKALETELKTNADFNKTLKICTGSFFTTPKTVGVHVVLPTNLVSRKDLLLVEQDIAAALVDIARYVGCENQEYLDTPLDIGLHADPEGVSSVVIMKRRRPRRPPPGMTVVERCSLSDDGAGGGY